MEVLSALDVSSLLSILYVALGLGLVIFFHELGHFAVAKWCDVNVERFSIGFGPILWSRKWGETEYAFSAIPFGGYVKMLGQDDADPSQLTSEEIAADPRSYIAKPVWQRMAIISAGVTMNIITGLLFFALAFGMGREILPPIVGGVQTGMPAWQAGIEPGDRITKINDRDVVNFDDIIRTVILWHGDLSIEGVRHDGTTFETVVQPDRSGSRPAIGVEPTSGLKLHSVVPGMSAARTETQLKDGDLIRQVDDVKLRDFAHLQEIFAERAADTLTLTVERPKTGKEVTAELSPNHFRTLGLWMDSGQIAAIQRNSPAEQQGLQVGDKIARVDGLNIGRDINPLRLPDYFAERAGQSLEVVVIRQLPGGPAKEVVVHLVPEDEPRRAQFHGEGAPLTIPTVGLAFHILPVVLHVEPDSPAAQAKIQPNATIKKMQLILPSGQKDDLPEPTLTVDFEDEKSNNWTYAFWLMQQTPLRTVELTVKEEGELRTVKLTPQPAKDWYLPMRGIRTYMLTEVQQADNVSEAFAMALTHTRNSMLEVYLTLRSLVTGALSYRELHGPIGIAKAAYNYSERGFSSLLLFLGFLSVNLAVLNFLPIPVLDGGHMVFLIWEGITRRRPSERVLIAATYLGMAFVLFLMGLVLYLDIFVHRLGVN